MVDAERNINRLVGEWDLHLAFKLEDGSMGRGDGSATATSVSLGRGLLFVLKGNMEGIGDYEQNILVAYNQETELVHLFSVTSMGVVHAHTGRWMDEDNLTLQWSGTYDGRPATQNLIFTFKSEDEFIARQEDWVEGNLRMSAQYNFRRSGRKKLEEPVPSVV